jgi:hypothetical protein
MGGYTDPMGVSIGGIDEPIIDNASTIIPEPKKPPIPAVVTTGPPSTSTLKATVEPEVKKELTAQQKESIAINGEGWKDPVLDTTYNIAAFPAVGSNPLNKFVSYNCLLTLACLDMNDQNAGKFDKSKIKNVIARTQGDWGSNNRVKTTFGQFDYFIDDLIMVTQPKISSNTGETFATKISFKVTEPYSMGLFLEAMLEGAQKSNYQNFREASYLLMIEFAGYTDDNKPHAPDPLLTRYIPIRFIDIKFSVKSGGSTYECEAIPYNELGFRSPLSDLKTNSLLKGSKVYFLLMELQNTLNGYAMKMIGDNEMDYSDRYTISYPKDFSQTQDLGSASEIANSIVFKGDEPGNINFPNQDETYDPFNAIIKNKSLGKIDFKEKTFQVNSGVKVQDVISEVILKSDYITNQLTNAKIKVNKKGMLKWFRIGLQVSDGPYSKTLNRQTRIFNYRIVPYEVHISKLLPSRSIPVGYEEIKKTVNRIYNYIYTGKNTEIISFDIDYNMAFFTNLSADIGNNPGTNTSGQRLDGSVTDKAEGAKKDPNPTNSNQGFAASELVPKNIKADRSGSFTDDNAQVKNYREMLTSPSDMIEVKMTIMGDPYYLPNSGFGNQLKKAISDNMMEDGSMNYESGEVDIVINFRTPTDLNPETGLYNFDTRVDQFSGLFEIFEVETKINQNKFTQLITARRRRTQLRGSGTSSTIIGN